MKKNLIKKSLVLILALAMISLVFGSIGYATDRQNITITNENKALQCMSCEITNITVLEAWDLLTYTGNGVQIPIDVRNDYEWYSGFIDTPYPECPVWYTLDFLKNETGLQHFIDTYDGQDIILYCKGGYRSLFAANIICLTNFTGTIYNMLGGITAWIAEGLPIRNNTPPDAPGIDGPIKGKVRKPHDYTFTTTDLEEDAVWYWVEWCEDGCCNKWHGPYGANEEVTLTHTWTEKGTHTIRAKVKDFYGNESGWTELEVKMPRSIEINLFEWLFERFPNAFPIIRHILGL